MHCSQINHGDQQKGREICEERVIFLWNPFTICLCVLGSHGSVMVELILPNVLRGLMTTSYAVFLSILLTDLDTIYSNFNITFSQVSVYAMESICEGLEIEVNLGFSS